MTLIAPTSNPARRQWAQIIQNSYVSAGIDAHLVYMSFGQWLALVLGNSTCGRGGAPPPVIAGAQNCPEPSFANGGWDAGFLGNGGGTTLPDFSTQNVVLYRGDTAADFPPTGQNYYWWTNSTYNQLAQDYGSNFNASQRLADARQMVRIVADQRPGVIIEYPLQIYAWNPNFMPWGTTNAITETTAGLDWQHWATGSTTTVNAAVTGSLDSANPLPNPTQNSEYDRYIYGSTGGTAQFGTGALEEADARGTGVYIDAIANRIVVSPDHLKYTISFKAHSFQDGVAVTSDDYVFTNMAEVISAVSYVAGGTTLGALGTSDQFTFLNGTTDYVNNGVYQHGGSPPAGWTPSSVWNSINQTAFSFTLPAPYLFADPEITATGALPMHLLEQLPFASWQTSPLSGFTSGCSNGQDIMSNPCPQGGLSGNNFKVTWNSARYGGNGSYIAYGPVGDGAYVYHGFDSTTSTATLVKYSGYWNATGLEALHEFTISTVHIVSIPGKDAAIAAYGTGSSDINFLDGQYTFNKDDATALANLGATVARVNDPANGWQEMPLNDANPIWGTGIATPKGQSDQAHASLYAKYVRTALSFLIPRENIVNNLLQGLGTPGLTEFFPTQGVITPGDIYTGVTGDPYNQGLALSYLASAGYDTGYNPISQGGGQQPIPNISVANITLRVPDFVLGNSLTFSGTFPVIPAVTAKYSGFFVTLQRSLDNGSTWEPVALGTATSGGYYNLAYTPTSPGNQSYRVFLTGIPVSFANGSAGPLSGLTVPGPGFVESYAPPRAPADTLPMDNATDVLYSASTKLNIGTSADLFNQLGSGINGAFTSLASKTTAAINTVNSNLGNQISALQGTAATQSALASLSSQVSSLNSQVSTLTTIAYAALAVAIILGLLAIFLAMRKKSS